jgi:molybdopterin molybdotransferase
VKSPPGRAQYLRGELEAGDRTVTVSPVGGPGSHLIGDLSQANALIVVPTETTSLDAGATVTVVPLDREF